MKLFTFCSNCGYRLGRSKSGTETEMICPKCASELVYEVQDDRVIVVLKKARNKKDYRQDYYENGGAVTCWTVYRDTKCGLIEGLRLDCESLWNQWVRCINNIPWKTVHTTDMKDRFIEGLGLDCESLWNQWTFNCVISFHLYDRAGYFTIKYNSDKLKILVR